MTQRYLIMPIIMAKIKNTDDRLAVGEDIRGTLLHCWQEGKPYIATLEISMGASQKTGSSCTSRPSNITPGNLQGILKHDPTSDS